MMKSSTNKSIFDAATLGLREIIQAAETGSFLGSEEDLIAQLGVSRVTIRQVARLLEQEGWLAVRKGTKGGYFAASPDINIVERTVTSYLERAGVDPKEGTTIDGALWLVAVQQAASMDNPAEKKVLQSLYDQVAALRTHAAFDDVLSIELDIRAAVFELAKCCYIELIFQINFIFARRQFPHIPGEVDDTPFHQEFVKAWRDSKLIELASILDGDATLAVLAARRSSQLWQHRVWNVEIRSSKKDSTI